LESQSAQAAFKEASFGSWQSIYEEIQPANPASWVLVLNHVDGK
jgi:hypothetical protein